MSKSGKNCFWRKTLSSTRPKRSAKKKKRQQKHLACLEHHVPLAKQPRQVSHRTNQVVDADSNAAAAHHLEVEEASSNKIEDDHHHENVLNIATDPDQETEAEKTATDVETRIRGPAPQSTRSAKTVRRWVTTREPAELVNPSQTHRASRHRRPSKRNWWLNNSNWYLRLIEAEIRHQVLLDHQKFSQSTTQKNWSSFKWRLRLAMDQDNTLKHCQTRAPTSQLSSRRSCQSWACQTKT